MTTTPASAPRRIVFVNHSSPARPDVSSLRMSRFARALAGRGARTLLLTAGGGADGIVTPLTEAESLITNQDGANPVHIACAPVPAPWIERARTGRLPSPLRQLVLAYSYARHGGVFPDWTGGAAAYLSTVATAFKPDIVIGTFGNTGTWSVAAALAGIAGVPWIADLKDNWGAFLPTGFAAITARRFAGMAHMTVYSDAHRAEADRWFVCAKTVVYSGFDHVPSHSAAVDGARITLVGSIYDPAQVGLLIRALDVWRQAAGLTAVTLAYAGNEGARVTEVARAQGLPITVDDRGRLGGDDLGSLLASSAANAYVVHAPSLFQQKPLELLAAGRPVIAVPGEGGEVERLGRDIGGRLVTGGDAATLATALTEALASPMPDPRADVLARFTWDAQAAVLEHTVDRVLEARR